MERMALVGSCTEESCELGRVGELVDDSHGAQSGLLLDLAKEPLLEAFVRVDPPGRNLGRAGVIEDEELPSACDIADDTLADQGSQEVSAAPPDLSIGPDREPVTADARSGLFAAPGDVMPPFVGERLEQLRLNEVAAVHMAWLALPRMLCDPEHAHDLGLEASLFADLTHGRFLDRLSVVDPAAGNDGRELRPGGNVEDEELVGAGDRVFASDVDDDVRPGDQWLSARSLAL
jgi:hypothetical protein